MSLLEKNALATCALVGNTHANLLARCNPTCMTRFRGLSCSTVAPLSNTVHPNGRGQPLKYTSVLPTPARLLAVEEDDEVALVRRLVSATADGLPGARAPFPREWSACRPRCHSVDLRYRLDGQTRRTPAIDREWHAVGERCTLKRLE